jgi:hypothetical protein
MSEREEAKRAIKPGQSWEVGFDEGWQAGYNRTRTRLAAAEEALEAVRTYVSEALARATDPANEDYETGDEETADALLPSRAILRLLAASQERGQDG